MNARRLLLILITGVLLFSPAFGKKEDGNFPDFTCESSKGETITEDYIRANDIRIIIYGTPKSLKRNRDKLDRILACIQTMHLDEQLLYIVNFSNFPGILRNQIKRNMEQNSIELGIKIYADWNGFISKGIAESSGKGDVSVYIIGKHHESEERITDLSSETITAKIIELQTQTRE